MSIIDDCVCILHIAIRNHINKDLSETDNTIKHASNTSVHKAIRAHNDPDCRTAIAVATSHPTELRTRMSSCLGV